MIIELIPSSLNKKFKNRFYASFCHNEVTSSYATRHSLIDYLCQALGYSYRTLVTESVYGSDTCHMVCDINISGIYYREFNIRIISLSPEDRRLFWS